MAQNGSTSVLRDSNYVDIAVQDGAALVSGQSYLPLAVQDGANSQAVKGDSQGRLEITGAGTAGAPAGGVVSVQGVVGGEAIEVTTEKATTGGFSRPAQSATNTTILAANAARLGAVIVNETNKVLYLKLGATASLTSYTYKMAPEDRVEVPFGYTGIIDGIWSAAGSGFAQVTELT
jgi:hypothetical protein